MTKDEIMELSEQVGLSDNGLITNGDYTEELCKFFRLAYARGMLKQAEQGRHWSDCAVNSEPAYPAGECDCGGYAPLVRTWVGLTNEEVMAVNTIREAEKLLKEKNT